MNQSQFSRRLILKTAVALGASPLIGGRIEALGAEADGKLLAYVGTFSSPLRDVLPTQVDRPPGSGRGIHIFSINRESGAMTPVGVYELGTSPTCVIADVTGSHLCCTNETENGAGKQGSVSAF